MQQILATIACLVLIFGVISEQRLVQDRPGLLKRFQKPSLNERSTYRAAMPVGTQGVRYSTNLVKRQPPKEVRLHRHDQAGSPGSPSHGTATITHQAGSLSTTLEQTQSRNVNPERSPNRATSPYQKTRLAESGFVLRGPSTTLVANRVPFRPQTVPPEHHIWDRVKDPSSTAVITSTNSPGKGVVASRGRSVEAVIDTRRDGQALVKTEGSEGIHHEHYGPGVRKDETVRSDASGQAKIKVAFLGNTDVSTKAET